MKYLQMSADQGNVFAQLQLKSLVDGERKCREHCAKLKKVLSVLDLINIKRVCKSVETSHLCMLTEREFEHFEGEVSSIVGKGKKDPNSTSCSIVCCFNIDLL